MRRVDEWTSGGNGYFGGARLQNVLGRFARAPVLPSDEICRAIKLAEPFPVCAIVIRLNRNTRLRLIATGGFGRIR
jgi:hypothetical protein